MSEIRNELFYEQKNGYDRLPLEERVKLEEYCRGYMEFLDDSRTEREAVRNAVAEARKHGFVEFRRGMDIKPGMKIFKNNRGKALILAIIGRKFLS